MVDACYVGAATTGVCVADKRDMELTQPGDEGLPPPDKARTLLVYHHDGVTLVPLVPGVPIAVGRGKSADLAYRGSNISRRHARFELLDGQLVVCDLGSTNGTKVNGSTIEGTRVLRVHDEVALGSVMVIVTGWTARESALHGLDNHGQFMTRLQEEMVRARTFQRSMALVMIRDLAPSGGMLHRWAGRVRDAAREVDRVGVYEPTQMGVVLAEADRAEAMRFVTHLMKTAPENEPKLVFGVALYPESGRSPDQLVASARDAVLRANADTRIGQASHSQGVSVFKGHPEDIGREDGVVVRSPSMLQLYRRLEQVAPAPIPVLILGETGTGKEVVARALHARSGRHDKPMHSINCGAVPPNLLEGLLFGHEKGAFTGADRTHKGLFESANGGTILLDEIGEMPLPAQVALLRVLDHGVVQRLGSSKEIPLDVRIVAATTRDLETMVAAGTFRLDLMHRINLITLQIPPLRERLSELLPLCQEFIREANERYQRDVLGMKPQVESLLLKYHWPGNIRELRNVMERAVLIALERRITAEDLPDKLRDLAASSPATTTTYVAAYDGPAVTPAPVPRRTAGQRSPADASEPLRFKSAIRACSSALIQLALVASDDNHGRAAEILGMPRRTLSHKVDVYGLEPGVDPDALTMLERLSRPDEDGLGFAERIARIEARLLSVALKRTSGDVGRAARILGIDRRTASTKIDRYGLG